MAGKPQPREDDVPKQKTRTGLEIPVPKRGEVMDALRKVAQPPPKPKR
jgi:hypothetical protein